MKNNRQIVISEIITNCEIETQQQLQYELKLRGINSTQATLSRDIRDLRLIKIHTDTGKNIYAFPSSGDRASADNNKIRSILKECIISFAPAQNILVIKTIPGLASAACATIDSMNIDNLVGTLAGDDTAFLAMKDSDAALKLYHDIENLL